MSRQEFPFSTRFLLIIGVVAAFLAGTLTARAADTPAMKLDLEKKRLEIPGKVARQDVYAQLKGVIEYIAASGGGKVYESLFILMPRAEEILEQTKKLGLVQGTAAFDDAEGKHHLPEGPPVSVRVRWEADGKTHEHAVEEFVIDETGKEPMPKCDWTYIGSEIVDDPATGKKVPQVAVSQNVISLHHQDQWVLIQNPLESATDQSKHHTNKNLLPPAGTSITLILEVPKPPEGLVRIHAFLSGRVQGVGFRNFTQRAANQIGIGGWVMNLADGRVEIVAEGDKDKMAQFEKQFRRGPRPARVENVELKQETATNMFKNFSIKF